MTSAKYGYDMLGGAKVKPDLLTVRREFATSIRGPQLKVLGGGSISRDDLARRVPERQDRPKCAPWSFLGRKEVGVSQREGQNQSPGNKAVGTCRDVDDDFSLADHSALVTQC
jgi:hypothetical protein